MSTIGLADELCQLLPCLTGLLLEAGRVCPCGLEQKLLPTLDVDLAKQLVDLLSPRAHAASWSSTPSVSSTRSRAGRRKTPATTKAVTSSPPRTTKEVWKPLTVAAALVAETP